MSNKHLRKKIGKFGAQRTEEDISFKPERPDFLNESMRTSFVERRMGIKKNVNQVEEVATDGEGSRGETPILLNIEDIEGKDLKTQGILSDKGTVRYRGEASHALSEGKNMFTREPELGTVIFGKTLDFKKDVEFKRLDNNQSKMSDKNSILKNSTMANIFFNE